MIEKVDSSKLNLMPGEFGFWFRGAQSDFSIIFNEKTILYFEYNSSGAHLSGGREKQLRFGRVKKDPSEKVVGFKRSDLIEYESEIPEGLTEEALRFIDECDFEASMKSGVMEHLRGQGRNSSSLESQTSYESYVEAKRNNQVSKGPGVLRKQALKIVMTLVFLALVFWTYSLLNISEYERGCREGNASSCQHLVFIETLRGNKERVRALVELEKEALGGAEITERKSKCQAGDFEACLILQKSGVGELSETRILEWACKGANEEYCLKQALGYLQGKSLPIDAPSLSKVRSVLTIGDHGDILKAISAATGEEKCENGEECYQYGTELTKHGLTNMAAALYEESCRFDHRDGCLASAEIFDRNGDKTRALEVYRADCLKTKNSKSCFNAAFAQFSDPGDRKSLREAYELCQKGSENYCMFLYDRVSK